MHGFLRSAMDRVLGGKKQQGFKRELPGNGDSALAGVLEEKASALRIFKELCRFEAEFHHGFPVLLPEARIAYLPAAKVAHTSMKSFLFHHRTGHSWQKANVLLLRYLEFLTVEVQAGLELEDVDQSHIRSVLQRLTDSSQDLHLFTNIHRLLRNKTDAYQSLAKLRNFDVVAIIRDPVDRIVSTYNFFVFQEKEIERMDQNRLPVEGTPTLDQFVEHVEVYSELSKVLANHLKLQRNVYGPDLSQISHLVPLDAINIVYEKINNKSNNFIKHYNENKLKKTIDKKINSKNLDKINKIYSEDFDLYEKACRSRLD